MIKYRVLYILTLLLFTFCLWHLLKDNFVCDLSRESNAVRTAKLHATNTSSKLLLPPLANQTGHWIGNTWIPPMGWKSFSADELRTLYSNVSTLWYGDSTCRRASATFFAILEDTDPNPEVERINQAAVIDINKAKVTETCTDPIFVNQSLSLCRKMPVAGDFLLKTGGCIYELEEFLLSELAGNTTILNEVDVMIIALGIWESLRPFDCRVHNRDMWTLLNDTLSALATLAAERDVTILWRTSGYNADVSVKGKANALLQQMNTFVMNRLDELAASARHQSVRTSNLFYVHWGGAMLSRSFGDNRVVGDMKPHYGLEARYALIQMVTNILYERTNVLSVSG